MRHDLPGGWVDLRASSDLTERQARPVRKAYTALAGNLARAMTPDINPDTFTEADLIKVIGPDYIDARDAYQDALIVAYVAEWSWSEPSSDAADVLPIAVYNALVELCEAADRDQPVLGPDGASDPKAPTGISTDSEQP